MMNLVVSMDPNSENFKQIMFQEIIYFDGLTKDRVMNSIAKVFNGFLYILTVFDDHKITRPRFDPSNLI